MKKAVVAGLLMLLLGFLLWQMAARELFNPAEKVAVTVDKENFTWFACSSCRGLFMAEATTRKGYCPYCGFQLMLITEDKKILGTSVDEKQYVWFLDSNVGKLFYALETKEMGWGPYSGISIDLTAPPTRDLEEEPPHGLLALAQTHFGKLLAGSLALFVISMAGIYTMLQRRVVLSLQPVEEKLSDEMKIELSRRELRKKRLTLGDSDDCDIVLTAPPLKDIHCILSFVRVGGKTHAYLRNRSNTPVCVNDKLLYNPQLKDHDKVKLGEVVFEVHTREK